MHTTPEGHALDESACFVCYGRVLRKEHEKANVINIYNKQFGKTDFRQNNRHFLYQPTKWLYKISNSDTRVVTGNKNRTCKTRYIACVEVKFSKYLYLYPSKLFTYLRVVPDRVLEVSE